MEYSPMMVVMLWALTPSDCWPTGGGGSVEQARVVEMPQPIMSVHPEGGYFTFNHGRPFLGERDPLTGTIDSNIKTTPVTSDDYLYDEYEESGESIDRKDGGTKIYTRNDIASSSKENDLHKFLNLPVHYSSSGKFPLISSSYANTKVQGHGPLSNHKLHVSSVPTTSTISPSYYTHKTTELATTPRAHTTTTAESTSTSTSTSSPSTTTSWQTTIPIRTSSPTVAIKTTKATTVLTFTTPRTATSTTTSKFSSPNYEYEYEYEYEKGDDDDDETTENTAHDYEFLGASSEVTKTADEIVFSKAKTSTNSPIQSSTVQLESNTTQNRLILSLSSSTTPSTTTASRTIPLETTIITSTSTEKPTSAVIQVKEQKKPETLINIKNEEIVDLRPPKPDISVELRPPEVHPINQYSSIVVSNKPNNLGYGGFIRYPESPLTDGKKYISVYSSEHGSKIKTEIASQTKLSGRPQDGNQNLAILTKPVQTEKTNPINNKSSTDSTAETMVTKTQSKLEADLDRDGTKISSIEDKTHLIINRERPHGVFTNENHRLPLITSTLDHIVSLGIPLDKHKAPLEIIEKPVGKPMNDRNRPILVTEANRHEEHGTLHNKHQGMFLKPEYIRPQGIPTTVLLRPHQEQRPTQILGNKPPGTLPENIKPHIPSTTEIKVTHKLQGTKSETRLQTTAKPMLGNARPQNSHLPHNNYSPEHKRYPSYQVHDPHHIFGLKITERPHGAERPSGLEQLRPHSAERPSLMDHTRPHSAERPSLMDHTRPHGVDRPPGLDHSRPQGADRPTSLEHSRPHGTERPLSLEYSRPHGTRIPEGKPHHAPPDHKMPSGIDMRPVHNSEIRQGDNTQRPSEGSVKPVIFSKPQSGKRPEYNTVQFGQPSKVENHFISVSPGQENPSYSLQTSFSIGVPPPEQKQTSTGGHGVGQVLFPDEEPEKRPPVWPHQRPPQSQSDPHPSIEIDKYPRPSWESHLKPPHVFHKKEPFPPIKRKPLPNILPQFRPNAKIGHSEPHIYLKPREPYDTLQPPPLPRPQFLKLEQDLEETKPLVHRRNGQSSGGTTSNRVTTLQMMQGSPPALKRATLRIDETNEKNEPVFVVYPSNGNNGVAPSTSNDAVVVGTRGSQRPLPPDNLDIGDELDSFPLDSNNNFQTRVDTPILKSKPSTSKPMIKNEFPYALIKPNPEERIATGSVVTKDYTAFSPTVASIEKNHDTEINIIPYLQDYMPFATKKPQNKDAWILGTDVKLLSSTASTKQQTSVDSTQTSHKNEKHKVVSEGPMPQDFQAPFHASQTAPSQGWSVVQKKLIDEKSNQVVTTTKETSEISTTEEPKFDIQNFKPQLFGGFKPIVPPLDSEKKTIA